MLISEEFSSDFDLLLFSTSEFTDLLSDSWQMLVMMNDLRPCVAKITKEHEIVW